MSDAWHDGKNAVAVMASVDWEHVLKALDAVPKTASPDDMRKAIHDAIHTKAAWAPIVDVENAIETAGTVITTWVNGIVTDITGAAPTGAPATNSTYDPTTGLFTTGPFSAEWWSWIQNKV